MKSFKEFIQGANVLYVFDIDDTLFRTGARVIIMKDGRVVKKISPTEYNTYVLKPGESYDYGEFRSAEVFRKTAVPIDNVIEKARKIIGRSVGGLDEVVFLTARGDFDDKNIFIKVFADHGIDIRNHAYVERSGNLNLGSAAKNKRFILHKYLTSGRFRKIVLFDDSEQNITMFKALAKHYKSIKFVIYRVREDGSIERA